MDVVVDGQFVEAQADPSLLFRGSANQRIIDVAASLRAGEAIQPSDFAYLE
ncbi:MAG: 4Fe-4S cluster-binding domain-containing protein [Candidatus Limisoma sp.]